MQKRNLGNYRTTIFGALVAVLTALTTVPGLEAWKDVLHTLAALAGSVGLYLAKDAATGSEPGSKS